MQVIQRVCRVWMIQPILGKAMHIFKVRSIHLISNSKWYLFIKTPYPFWDYVENDESSTLLTLFMMSAIVQISPQRLWG